MFICEPCRDKNWPALFSWSWSRGRCEVCGEYALCFDIHHNRLPDSLGICAPDCLSWKLDGPCTCGRST